jgi:hypothetical protein
MSENLTGGNKLGQAATSWVQMTRLLPEELPEAKRW